MSDAAMVSQEFATPTYKDRSGGLVVFGVLEILAGGFCALCVPLSVLAMAAAVAAPGDVGFTPRMMVPNMIIFGVMAVALIWLGIGSLRARRWARALWLVIGWIGLVSGVLGLVYWGAFMGDVFEHVSEIDPNVPAGFASILQIIMTGFMVIFYIVIPLVLVLFYGGRNVKATCEARDPTPRWTDRRPLPVLALSVLFFGGALCMTMMASYDFLFPWFGAFISGRAGMAATAVVCATMFYVSWGCYRLQPAAWLLGIVLVAVMGCSGVMTMVSTDLIEMYRKMGFPEQQLDMLESMQLPEGKVMGLWTGASAGLFLLYMLCTGRYFLGRGAASDEAA